MYILAICLLLLVAPFGNAEAAMPRGEDGLDAAPAGSASQAGVEWGGHIKARGNISFVSRESLFRDVETGTYYDGSVEGRLKNRLSWRNQWYFETHYEIIASGGDTERRKSTLPLLAAVLPSAGQVNDSRRLLHLTRTIDQGNSYTVYHRLDRLSLTLQREGGIIRIGRQAVTWGNGMVFNPMDLFNPFTPTDIEREYKIGDDMAFAQVPLKGGGDLQVLCVPRRDPVSGRVEEDQTSVAGRFHFAFGTTEFDLMAAKHYGDGDAGFGLTGYLGEAAWRTDLVLTIPEERSDRNPYLSCVANIDYSWVWLEKNFYGFIELYYSGLGRRDYKEALGDPYVAERLSRGDLFTLGRSYAAAHTRIELHPLVNLFFTAIVNAGDLSGIVQPRLAWDMTRNTSLICGGNIYFGAPGTEYGGFVVPGTALIPGKGLSNEPPNNFFLWIAYYF